MLKNSMLKMKNVKKINIISTSPKSTKRQIFIPWGCTDFLKNMLRVFYIHIHPCINQNKVGAELFFSAGLKIL